MVQIKGAVLLALVVLCIAHEACARPAPREALGPKAIDAAGRVLQQLRTLQRKKEKSFDPDVVGPANGITKGLIQVRKGPNSGAGARSNCKAFNSLDGKIRSINAKPGDERLTGPPPPPAGTEPREPLCEGVLEEFNAGTSGK